VKRNSNGTAAVLLLPLAILHCPRLSAWIRDALAATTDNRARVPCGCELLHPSSNNKNKNYSTSNYVLPVQEQLMRQCLQQEPSPNSYWFFVLIEKKKKRCAFGGSMHLAPWGLFME